MNNNNFHKDFKLNGTSFSSVDEILKYSKNLSDEIYFFLQDWFSTSQTITVKTSGSTGTPKDILLKKFYVINSAKTTGNYFEIHNKTRALLCLPIQYIAGKMMLIRAIILGWHLDIINSSSSPLKDVIKSYDFCAMIPLQLENSITKITLIKKIIVGGGVVSNQLVSKIKNVSTKIFFTYGMTETITHIAVKKLNHFKNNLEQHYFKVLPNVSIYIDERNCLVIDAPKVADNLIVTNDIVQLASDKHFSWIGRYDNIINSGGIKLNPEDIEQKLSTVIEKRFFVTSIPDKEFGEKLVLIVENMYSLDYKSSLELKIQHLELLSKYEKPKEIYFVKNFIETKSGKIQRKETKEIILEA